MNNLTITKAHNGLKKKEFSAVELTTFFLNKIKKQDKKISSYITVSDELALFQAKEIDKKIAKKQDLPVLAGVPMAVKDIISVKGLKNTCASKILKDYIAPYDATCIKKLKELGAVILGKTNLDEFAMGSSTENSAFSITKNPCDLKMVPGGSSGGSAAAVAADLCCYSLGSDTGGSIRQPASFCGAVGLKPSYGAVSRYGLVAFASSLDQIGPITKTVEDAQIVFNAIKGKDVKDSTSVDSKYEVRSTKKEGFSSDFRFRTSDLKIGIPKEYFIKGIDPEVEEIIKKAISFIEKQGAKIEEISLPHTKYALAAYYIIMPSEASANLARYDGIKYGLSKSGNKSLLDVYLESRGQGFGKEVKRRIMLGTYTLSAGYYDAYYLKAQKVRTLIKQDFENAFKKVDAIFTPTSPFPAFKIGEKIADPLSMYLSDIFTVSVNLAGLPALSAPVGFTKAKLPVGLQIIGKPFEDNKILEISKIYDK
jgi:aspartyl-tRNA(Asn)/glutamyl-tRNA(Gln) amidotransferase subunit A